MKSRIRLKALASVNALMFAIGVSILAAPPAHAAVSGTVECDGGASYPVVGVWIDSSDNSHDGFASWTRLAGQPNKATYSKSNVGGETYKAYVGCGGNTTTWGQTSYSGWVTGGQDFICHVSSSVAQRVCNS